VTIIVYINVEPGVEVSDEKGQKGRNRHLVAFPRERRGGKVWKVLGGLRGQDGLRWRRG